MKDISVLQYQINCTVIFACQKWRKYVLCVFWWASNSDKQSLFTSSRMIFYSIHDYIKINFGNWIKCNFETFRVSCIKSNLTKNFLWVSKRDFFPWHQENTIHIFLCSRSKMTLFFLLKVTFKILSWNLQVERVIRFWTLIYVSISGFGL